MIAAGLNFRWSPDDQELGVFHARCGGVGRRIPL